ncbi:MAG: DUF1849 family protein [Rhodospirillaceae bacterium]|nr:DUF1849 family protein [Rhodospirillaceae bacterium]
MLKRAAILFVLAGAAPASALPSYDATYSIRLLEASAQRGPRAAVGTLEFKFRETCDGWETVSNVRMTLAFRDGTALDNERNFTSWEAKDGSAYNFAVRTLKGGIPVEAFKGNAVITSRSGTVAYELPGDAGGKKPRKLNVRLPRGTLLPVAYLNALLDHARRGESMFQSVVFSGASSYGPRTLSAAIGPRVDVSSIGPNGSTAPAINSRLLDGPAYDLSLAFYNLIERRETPNFEVFQRYLANGIARSFEQEFDDFRIGADLQRLTELPAPSCG